MKLETFEIPYTGERVLCGVHESGLPIRILRKEGYRSAYATVAVRYGSVDNAFFVDGRLRTVPAGIAHYLEHKLFESEDGDAFLQYAKTGANANAYTSFQQTAYLFSCTENFERSLEILLHLVQDPYFTEENVEKERGIIGQEIRMCEDDPDRLAMFNALEMLYAAHPVRIDIAGTQASIAKITPQLLYDCYSAFYNLRNMVLTVCGDVDEKTVTAVADRMLKTAPPLAIERRLPQEPTTVSEHRRVAHMEVAAPVFHIGFKEPVTGDGVHTGRELMAAQVLLELLCGHASPLYADLMAKGLINETFGSGYFEGAGFGAFLFSGESRDADAVAAALVAEIERMRRDGIDGERFEEEKRALFGQLITGLNSVESCADWMADDCFYGRKPFALIDSAAKLDVQSVYTVLHKKLCTENMAVSLVLPKGE